MPFVLILIVLMLGAMCFAGVGIIRLNGELQQLRTRLEELQEATSRNMQVIDEEISALKAATAARPATTARPAIPADATPAPQPTAGQSQLTLFLSRPDATGLFARASLYFEPGNSLFKLTVDKSGTTGRYEVIDDPEVHRLALMMPAETLAPVCSGDELLSPAGKRRIVTLRQGVATQSEGRWFATQKSLIRYE